MSSTLVHTEKRSSNDELKAMRISEEQKLENRLRALTNQSRLMLFMKGSVDMPKCGEYSREKSDHILPSPISGFSHQIVQMLRDSGAKEVHMRISAPPIRSWTFSRRQSDSGQLNMCFILGMKGNGIRKPRHGKLKLDRWVSEEHNIRSCASSRKSAR